MALYFLPEECLPQELHIYLSRDSMTHHLHLVHISVALGRFLEYHDHAGNTSCQSQYLKY